MSAALGLKGRRCLGSLLVTFHSTVDSFFMLYFTLTTVNGHGAFSFLQTHLFKADNTDPSTLFHPPVTLATSPGSLGTCSRQTSSAAAEKLLFRNADVIGKVIRKTWRKPHERRRVKMSDGRGGGRLPVLGSLCSSRARSHGHVDGYEAVRDSVVQRRSPHWNGNTGLKATRRTMAGMDKLAGTGSSRLPIGRHGRVLWWCW